ncbi:hypothetical protein SAMN05444358_11812 [Ruegeria halocynthiae]|uniref:Uncharacterized protein n=1 Tax=Ruegeria halocynthiae TaxID=985054 RepID=A0A1H3FT27_9RHOB|nr:hypothetical protein [Ruegeria halocynthiae]SDX94233.1 hypothetical protein SAMN05444358_11812 [Ruegeria halocynthiae]
MSILFIPNDPRAGNPPNVAIAPHDDRPNGLADFVYQGVAPEGEFAIGTDEFLFWQCREAALQAIDLWEAIDQPLIAWQPGQTLRLIQKTPGQPQLNAFYNRHSLSFFEVSGASATYQSGASTDVVAHEAGHAFLDAIRPDLWDALFGEQGAFHESFGDCIAILTALEDQVGRQALVSGDLLRQDNFVESTAEDLSHGIGALINPNHNAAIPRKAFNTHQWALPSSLPVNGGPGALINEVHSLGMIFNGCFYDTLTNIYQAGADHSEAGLLTASRTAGRLLAAAARSAPLQSRFFQSVGNAMLLADQDQNAGVNAAAITDGFGAHNISLSATQMLAPTNVLAGRAPAGTVSNVRDIITRASRRDLVSMVGEATQQRFLAKQYSFGPQQRVAAVAHQHKVPLGDVSEKLEGVVCLVQEDVLIGADDGQAAALGMMPSVGQSVAEVQNFVYSLNEAGQIDIDGEGNTEMSHSVHRMGTERRLVRTRFSCACGRCHQTPSQNPFA